MLSELPAHRDLLWLLVVREIRVRYARAALGAAWAVFPPLVMMTVFSVMNFGRLIEPSSDYAKIPYPVFAYMGLLPWAHFSTSLTQATPSLIAAAAILKKSRFPHEVVPLSRVLAALLDLGVGVVVLVGLLAWNYVSEQPTPSFTVGPTALVVIPIFALQFTFTVGLALLLSAANMFYRDVNYLLQVGIVLAMFATSVVYPIAVTSPGLGTILALNPMSAYLDAYRAAVLLGQWPSLDMLMPGILGAIVSLTLGAYVFAKASHRFPEEV